MIELLLLAQLVTEPKTPSTPPYSWEQQKPVQPPDFKPGVQSGGSNTKRIEEFERQIFEYPS